jgi:hypothetical protein
LHPAYDNTQAAFSEANLVLMRKVLDYRTQPEQERDGEALVAALSSFVQAHPEAGWVAAERESFVQHLERALRNGHAQAAQAQAQAEQAPALTPETDVSALPGEAQETFRQAHAAAQQGQMQAAFDRISPLADAHEGSYAVQSLACRVAMSAGRMTAAVQRYCERMASLAASASAGASEGDAPGVAAP